jgi:Mg2+ and Co2+ transporter CorA
MSYLQIFHLITQDDTQTTISLAKDSKVISEDSKNLAQSMRILALVTLFFLPPTAIATFFAMPFFDWGQDNSEMRVSNSMWIFGATAGPLTAVTVAVWAASVWRIEKRKSKANEEKYKDV